MKGLLCACVLGPDLWSSGPLAGCSHMCSGMSSVVWQVPSFVDGAPEVFFLGHEHGLLPSFFFWLPCRILIDVFMLILSSVLSLQLEITAYIDTGGDPAAAVWQLTYSKSQAGDHGMTHQRPCSDWSDAAFQLLPSKFLDGD